MLKKGVSRPRLTSEAANRDSGFRPQRAKRERPLEKSAPLMNRA